MLLNEMDLVLYVYTSYIQGLHSHNWPTRWTIILLLHLLIYLALWMKMWATVH